MNKEDETPLPPKELEELERRVQQVYWNDGLIDLLMGSIMLIFAVFFLAASEISAYPSSSIGIYILPQIFFSLFVIFLAAQSIEAAKRRWVYPRSGYVKLKPLDEGTRRDSVAGLILILSILLGPVIVLVVLAGLAGAVFWLVWVAPVSLGSLLGIGPMIVARKYRLRRYYLFAVLPCLVGLMFPWLNIVTATIYAGFYLVLGLEFATVGILAILSGAILFLRFIRRYPIEPTEMEEG